MGYCTSRNTLYIELMRNFMEEFWGQACIYAFNLLLTSFVYSPEAEERTLVPKVDEDPDFQNPLFSS